MAGDRILDPELARRLVLHEARAQQAPARELRDLGDGWLLHDPSDAEPFWNRVIAPQWPADPLAFDRRLDEVVTLFATLGRLPHVRPLPCGGAPDDLAARLTAAGFETLGADRRMVLVRPDPAAIETLLGRTTAAVVAGLGPNALRVSRQAASPLDRRRGRSRLVATHPAWPERRSWAEDAALVLAEAFAVGTARQLALESDVRACISRPGCSMVLIEVDGEPAAVARRASTVDGSYLSSIGTRPRFRGRGLGALATLLVTRDALEASGDLVHLAVEVDNEPARRLYERLGFRLVGEPAPDLLLQ